MKNSNTVSKYTCISHLESCCNVCWVVHAVLLLKFPVIRSHSLWYCRHLHFGKAALASREWDKINGIFCGSHQHRSWINIFVVWNCYCFIWGKSTSGKHYIWIKPFIDKHILYLCYSINRRKCLMMGKN